MTERGPIENAVRRQCVRALATVYRNEYGFSPRVALGLATIHYDQVRIPPYVRYQYERCLSSAATILRS